MSNKLGIVIPYRDRHSHLSKFLPQTISYLKSKGFKFTIIVVEQDNASAFNRGMLCNIGFLEAQKQRCNYVVFHDIDMIPVEVDYSYSPVPVHLASHNIPFESYFGGMTMFPSDTFIKVNGFSNLYWGWGFEDDDLRYRCVKNGVEFQSSEVIEQSSKISGIFNGHNAYAEIPNVLNFSRDFTIDIEIKLDRVVYDHTKQVDTFPIFSIEGYDFTLSYTSFNRFYLQVFDQNTQYYDTYSDILTTSICKLQVKYTREENKIEFIVNGKLEGTINLTYQIFRYNKNLPIYLGTDPRQENFFKGTIETLTIRNKEETVIDYTINSGKGYRFSDNSGNNNHGKLHNVYFDKFTSPINYYSYIPFRRDSKIETIKHKNNGFLNGRWKDDLTRWNQLRYNNEVQNGGHDTLDDGLSSCEFILHGKLKNSTLTHLNVGI